MAAVRIDSDLPTLVDLLPQEAKVQRRVLRAVEKLVGELRGERVFVSPRQIASDAELELLGSRTGARGAVQAEVVRLRAAVPRPGRPHARAREAVRRSWRSTSSSKSGAKAAEYDKLDRMIDYATSRRCRQLEILDYFGDPSKRSAACATTAAA